MRFRAGIRENDLGFFDERRLTDFIIEPSVVSTQSVSNEVGPQGRTERQRERIHVMCTQARSIFKRNLCSNDKKQLHCSQENGCVSSHK